MPGPVPKRSEERRRQNKPDRPASKVPAGGPVVQPEAPADLHPLAASWYESLSRSGQARYYEPSDWETARVTAVLLSEQLLSGKPSSMMLTALFDVMRRDLLSSEGARRVARLEVERKQAEK